METSQYFPANLVDDGDRSRFIVTLIRILGGLHALIGGSGLLAGLGFCVKTLVSSDPAAIETLRYFGPAFLLIGVPLLMPQFVAGIGLFWLKRWARIVIILISAIYLMAFPYGTPVGIFGLAVLLSGKARLAFGEPPAAIAARAAFRRKRNPTAGVLLTMAAVGVGVFILLWIGFSLDDQPAPAPFSGRGPAAVAIIAGFAVVLGLLPVVREASQRLARRKVARGKFAASQRDRAARIALLAADPARRTYAALMEKGETWSDEQIVYDQDRQRLATCPHLRPIEQAMRQAGVRVRLIGPSAIMANCRIDRAGLERRSLLAGPAAYLEYVVPDRPPDVIPVAELRCQACASVITVLHPQESPPGAAWFPDAPGG